MRWNRPRLVRHAVSLAAAGALVVLAAAPTAAHGGVVGTQDVLQDYGVLLFLLAVVLIGAGVVTWVALSPEPARDEADDERPTPEGSDLTP